MKSAHRSLPFAAAAALALGLSVLPASAQFFRRPNLNTKPLQFTDIGPALAGGRVTSVVGIPGNPSVYYAGAAGGGVWKTTDGGNTWKPIFQHEATSSIGAIALAPSNPNLVWVGTGESNPRNDVMVGHGLYFSPDGGQTWTEIAPQIFHNCGQISRIVINPQDANEVWVAVLGHVFGPNSERGVFRTTDGGKTWQKTLFVNDTTGAIDLAVQPGNPKVLLAGMWQFVRRPWTFDDGGPGSGLYRSIDGGETWTRITAGLRPGPYGRIGLAFAPNDPERAYAIVQSKTGLFYVSNDAGLHWSFVSDNDALDARPFYFSRFVVAPNNPNKIYFLQLGINVSDDGGKTVHPAGRVHADNHAMWIDPDNPNRIIAGNDGGVWLSYDAGVHFTFLDTLPIEEFYMVSASNQVAYNICGGLQDNNAWCGPSSNNSSMNWTVVAGGDGQYAVFAPSDPNIVYGESQNGHAERVNISTGVSSGEIKPWELGVSNQKLKNLKYRFNWTTPIEVSPSDAKSVYMGGNVLFHSTNGGYSWTPISPDLTLNDKAKEVQPGGNIVHDITGAETYDTILSIALSPTDPKTIWVGTDDGLVQVTHDGGATWDKVSANIQGLPPYGRVQQIEVSPFDPNSAYAAFDFHMSDNNQPYVYKTHDGGKTWTSIAAGLPQTASARVVREDPNDRGLLICGTDTGLFISHDDGATWAPLRRGFPTVPVYDIQFVTTKYHLHDLLVATHGRGIFQLSDIIPLEQAQTATDAPLTVYPTVTDYELRGGKLGRGGFFGFGAAGAHIYYRLQDAVKGKNPVKIAITDRQGRTITTLNGTGRKGLNEVTWRGNYDGPVTAILPPSRYGFGFRFGPAGQPGKPQPDAGPRALPGTYKVTVTAGSLAPQTQTVRVAEDPRWPVPAGAAAANAESLRDALQARDEVSAMNEMLTRLQNLQNQLHAQQASLRTLQESGDGNYRALMGQASTLDKKAHTLEYVLYNPDQGKGEATAYLTDFQQDFQSIYRSLDSQWNRPPRPVDLQEWASERAQLEGYLNQYNTLMRVDVAAYNKAAAAQHAITLAAAGPVNLPKATAAEAAAANRP